MTQEPIVLQVKPISVEAFAPYGDLLETPTSGMGQDIAAVIENRRSSARVNLALVRSQPFQSER